MRSSSIKPLLDIGMTHPQKYRDALIHDWYLQPYYQNFLAEYFQRKIDAVDLDKRINKDATIYVGSKFYQVVWVNGPAAVKKNGRALLSFRYCKYLDIGYVLIKKLENGEDIETLQEQNAAAMTNEVIKKVK